MSDTFSPRGPIARPEDLPPIIRLNLNQLDSFEQASSVSGADESSAESHNDPSRDWPATEGPLPPKDDR